MRTNSAILATMVVIIFISLITIVAELSPLLKSWLKETFSHHWVGKSILAILLWIVIVALPIKLDIIESKLLLIVLIIASLAIIIFYTIHYLI